MILLPSRRGESTLGILVAALVVTSLAATRSASADAGTDATVQESRVVTFEATGAVDPELETTVRELLGRNGLVLVHGASAGKVVARVHVDTNDRGATVVVDDPSGATPTARRDVPAADSPALFRETLAHVILSAVDPFATAAEPKPATPPAEPPPTAPPPPPTSPAPVASAPPAPRAPAPAASAESGASRAPPASSVPATSGRSRLSFSLGAGVGARLLADEQAGAFFQGGGALTLESALRPSVAIDVGYTLPVRATEGAVDGRVSLVPLRAHARVEPLRYRWLSLETSVNAGLDVVSLSPTSNDPSVRLGEAESRAQPIVGASIAPRAHAGPNVDVVFSLGLDVDLAPRRWVLEDGSAHRELFETARFRPYFAVGLDWIAAGAAHVTEAGETP